MIEIDEGRLAQPVGLGLAGRGAVADVVTWARLARRHGLDSVWLHDTPFERDAVTYTSAIASQVPDIRVALGALNPFTRHPALVAMTVSALDDMAPGRVILGLGTGLPLRLAQMGIPYTPQLGVDRVSSAIDMLRALWAGERVPAADGVPPIQPMFPPVHRVPIYVAAYRSAFMDLAGQKADGYLARPAESVPGLIALLERLRAASVTAGRDAHAVQVAGYLLTHVDKTRREAVNRAKREPFVIYMLSVQSDLAFRRAGFEPELRERIAAAWRAEEYHRAAEIMPDDLLDAFILCGAREDVAARAWAYHEAGMDLPILQPILQEDEQVRAVIGAAVEYGEHRPAVVAAPSTASLAPTAAPTAGRQPVGAGVGIEAAVLSTALDRPVVADRHLSAAERLWRRAGAWYEIVRPFSLTASIVPVVTAGALAARDGAFSWPLFLAALIGGVLLQVGTNVVNEIYDVRKGIDVITSPRASQALLKGRLGETEAFVVATLAFVVAALIGVGLIAARGWPVAVMGLIGLIGGCGYTAPPLQYKYRALGLPIVFALMGPLMVVGTYYVVSGGLSVDALVMSVPVGLLVAAILHGNEWRDVSDDARAGIATFSIAVGRRAAHLSYLVLVIGAYMALAAAVALGVVPPLSILPMLSLPLLVRVVQAASLAASGQQRAIAMIDLQTAQLHAAFGLLLALGLVVAAVVQ
ncbi:MAG: LLM class flavin-dependent oxidoreductase [Chloroflexi bacterium]|nr:LLM class flavin-dependent oxidoreductase [Chloroflexota bacterium]